MNTHPINRESVAVFLRGYVAAFNSCDGAAIARHYACPSLSLRCDGVLSLLSSREQAEPFFASMARTHVDQGCADWRAESIRIHAIGSSPHVGKLPFLVNPLQAPKSHSCQ